MAVMALLLLFGANGPCYAQALDPMIARILEANQLSPELVAQARIEQSDSYNAYTDGSRIVITSALWNALDTTDERAFVASHEVAHIALNHVTKSAARNVGFGFLARLIGQWTGNGLATTVSSVGLQLIDRKFNRNGEYEADQLGLELMAKAGYNTRAALGVFETLDRASANGQRPPEFLSTHPAIENRTRAILQQQANFSRR